MSNTVSAKAGTLDIILEEGAGLTLNMTKFDSANTPVDLSGYTARLTIKESTSSTTNLMELTTENGGISLGTSTNNIVLIFSEANVSAAIWSRGIYNFYLTPQAGDPEREITGIITIAQGT